MEEKNVFSLIFINEDANCFTFSYYCIEDSQAPTLLHCYGLNDLLNYLGLLLLHACTVHKKTCTFFVAVALDPGTTGTLVTCTDR